MSIHLSICIHVALFSHYDKSTLLKQALREILRVFSEVYIDVDDGCWRPNVLVTSLRCLLRIQDVGY